MKHYQLSKETYIEDPDLHYVKIYNKNWLQSYKDTLQLLINYFNEEYTWEGMFNLHDADTRIREGHNLFLLYSNNRVIGYVWFKELDKDTCFGYNLYVTKKVNRPKNAPAWF